MRDIVNPLDPAFRATRTLQAPQHVQFDPATQTFEVSSAAFKKQSDGSISLDLEEILLSDGHSLDYGYPRVNRAVGLVAHRVSRLTQAKFAVAHDPISDNDYHGTATGNPSRGERITLADTCEIIRPIDQTEALARKLEFEQLARDAKAAKDGAASRQ